MGVKSILHPRAERTLYAVKMISACGVPAAEDNEIIECRSLSLLGCQRTHSIARIRRVSEIGVFKTIEVEYKVSVHPGQSWPG